MDLSNREILTFHRETKRPIAECKQALLAAQGDHEAARAILDAWSIGRAAPDGSVPELWRTSNSSGGMSPTGRRCPKCWHEFSAIPDVVTCPKCHYAFRSSSSESPYYFSLFTGCGPPRTSDWFIGGQLAAVQGVLRRLGQLGPPDEQRTMALLIEQLDTNRDVAGLHSLLTGLQRARLRAVGELLVAMAYGYDAVDEWIRNWAAPVREPGNVRE